MFRNLLLLLLVLAPTAAAAGLRATYGGEEGPPKAIEIADDGDIRAELYSGGLLMVIDGRAYIVEERLTGPLVTEFEHLAEIARADAADDLGGRAPALPPMTLVHQGQLEVNGRIGRAYYRPPLRSETSAQLIAVISDDPALRVLGRAMRRLIEAEEVLSELESERMTGGEVDDSPSLRLLDEGAPLRFSGRELRRVEHLPIPAERFALPAQPETREALQARLRQEAEEPADWADRMISRAVFASDRLWLLTDGGELSSLAETETSRRRHDLGEPVLDLCMSAGAPLALTGTRDRGRVWRLLRWSQGEWRSIRRIERAGDALLALSCQPEGELVVTTQRLIDLGRPNAEPVMLSEDLPLPRVRSSVRATREAVFIGLNAGEWGGGLRRIDRETGTLVTIERSGTGSACEGPLNSSCHPVNAIVPIPWRPGCVAAAVGLIHFMASGRIVAVCPDSIEQLFAAPGDIDPENRQDVAEAGRGGFGSVAFFDLVSAQSALLAAGHNGLYRIDARGGSHQRWPRFREVDGVYLSFERPDVILVLTQINQRASVSGSAPLLIER